MDSQKIGSLILKLRKEKGLTQRQLANQMNISDKAISKWERGLGCPDISLLNQLSSIFNINIEKILSGSLDPNEIDGGNMKRIKIFVCPDCGNIMTSTGESEISCCGRKLSALVPQKSDEAHKLNVETVENDYYVTFSHDMSKEHYINFIAYVGYDRMMLIKLYPEQGSEVRFPKIPRGKLYFGCNKHGLWIN